MGVGSGGEGSRGSEGRRNRSVLLGGEERAGGHGGQDCAGVSGWRLRSLRVGVLREYEGLRDYFGDY